MALCTREQVKTAWLDEQHTQYDDAISAAIAYVSAGFARRIGRYDATVGKNLLEWFVERTETHRPNGRKFIDLDAGPLERIVSIVEAAKVSELDSATPLTADDDYEIDPDKRGWVRIWRQSWVQGRRFGWGRYVRVVYNGGYITYVDPPPGDDDMPVSPPAGTSFPTLPSDLRDLAIKQVIHQVKHKNRFGERTLQVGTGTVEIAEQDLLEDVRKGLDWYRKTGPCGGY